MQYSWVDDALQVRKGRSPVVDDYDEGLAAQALHSETLALLVIIRIISTTIPFGYRLVLWHDLS